MPETEVVDAATTSTTTNNGSGEGVSLGWRAGLPDDLKQNTDIANYKTVGDFTKDALSWKGKVGELEGKLSTSIPKLPDDATDEDRNTYYDALGRPTKASEYEFDGEDKTDPKWSNTWKERFHKYGLTKEQAKGISADFNQMGQAYMAEVKTMQDAEYARAEQLFRAEVGDKYDTNVELAKRMYSRQLGTEFNADFADAKPNVRLSMIRLILKMSALTGEDTSPQGGHSTNTGTVKSADAWLNMYNNPKGKG